MDEDVAIALGTRTKEFQYGGELSPGAIVKTHLVFECFKTCPFFSTENHWMYCGHPTFYNNEEGRYIINHQNSHGTVPKECPLRREKKTIALQRVEIKLTLENHEQNRNQTSRKTI